MAGKTYSAGTIFLQVVPVFGDMQRQIRREVQDLNKTLSDDMEKGGAEAGQRAGKALGEKLSSETKKGAEKAALSFEKELKQSLAQIERDLKPIQPKFESNEVRKQLGEIRKEMADLRAEADKGLNPRAYREIGDRIRVLQSHAAGLNTELSDLQKHDFNKTVGGLDKLVKRMDSVRKAAEIDVRLDAKPGLQELSLFEKKARDTAKKVSGYFGSIDSDGVRAIRAELDQLSDVRIGIDMDADEAMRKIRQVEQQARRLAMEGYTFDIRAAAASAEADLAVLTAAADALDGKDVNIDVNTRGAAKAMGEVATLRALFGGASTDAENAANSFRSFNAVILAAVTLLPALVPMIGALGGALLGLLPILGAVTAGFGAMFVGFSGIGDAVGALGDVESDAAQTARSNAKAVQGASDAVRNAKEGLADAERAAGRAAEDAARAVANARREAARAIADALARQREAQRAYRDSVNDVREAEQALRDARKRAAQELKADKDDIADRLRQGDLAIREAQLAAFDATNTYNTVMADGSSTTYDKEAAEVAMLQAREALHELREEQEELSKAQKENAKAKVKDNNDVKQAESALERALESQRKAQENLKKAAEEVTRARVDGARRVADAVRNQQRAEADGARNVARAQRTVAEANKGLGETLYETGEIGSASMQKLEEAMGKLGPAGRRFAYFLFDLQQRFYNLRREVQERMLPGVQTAMEDVIGYFGPRFTNFMANMGGVVGSFALQISQALTTNPWTDFFAAMNDAAPTMSGNTMTAVLNFFTGLAAILTTATPYAVRMSEAWVRSSEAFASWASSQAGIDAVQRLMNYFETAGPKVGAFFDVFWDALINLGKALAPWGEMILGVLTTVLTVIAEMDTKKLGVIVTTFLALFGAFQIAAGAIALVNAGMAVMAFAGARILFRFLAAAGAVLAFATQYDSLGDVLDKVWGFIKKNRDMLLKLGEGILIAWAAWKTYRTLAAIISGIQLGIAAATYGAVGATYAQGTAAKVAHGFMKIWRGGLMLAAGAQWVLNASLLGFPLTWIILALVAVGVGLYLLWKKSETFRNIVNAVWRAVRGALKVLWEYWKWVFDIMWKTLKGAFGYMSWAWKTVLWPVLKVIGKIIWELWKLQFKPVLKLLREGWKLLWAGMRKIWDNGGRDVFEKVKKGLGLVRDAFRVQVERITNIWDGLRNALAAPVRFFLETVMNNGIIKGWNKFAKLVGADTIENIPVPGSLYPNKGSDKGGKTGGSSPGGTGQTYATGGILPGYTPGRDVHHFVSPTGGNLHLSGGEAILRPEATNVLGAGWVNAVNAAARRGGIGAVKALMGGQAFAKGGVFWPTTFRSLSGDYPGHTGVDISIPGSADYGLPVFAAHSGHAVRRDYGGVSYGNSVWITGEGLTTIYAHLSNALVSSVGKAVRGGQQIGNIGSTGNSSGPHLHFEVRPGGTRAAALAYLNGSYTPSGGTGYNGTPGQREVSSFPKLLRSIARKPMDWVKGLYEGPVKALSQKFDGGIASGLANLPGSAAKAIRNKAIGLLPAPLDLIAKKAGGVAEKVVGAVKDAAGALDQDSGGGDVAMAKGGILPYNGTMMYDSGGYLPPGLTSVVNLTGKPEPVFTADQFKEMGTPGGSGGFTYAPTFDGSDLTAEDVMDDLQFTARRLGLVGTGRYGRHD